MSAPDTNIETQKRQHRAPLAGIRGGLVVVLALFLLFIGWSWFSSDGPEGADALVDGRTGAVQQVAE